MSLRTPFAVAVVGALLIGGATTGTTLALWHDEATLAASQVNSGNIALTVNGATTADFGSISGLPLNSGVTPGTARSFGATLASSSAGKNMRTRLFLDDVQSSNTGINDGLEIAATSAATVADCTTATAGFEALSETNDLSITAMGIANGETRALCVSIRVKGSAGVAVQNQTGTLTFSFRGEQVRP